MFRTLLVTYFLLFCLSAVAAEPEPIAVIKTLDGPVWVERQGTRQAAVLNNHLHIADVVITGAKGRAGLLFSDGARVSLDPESTLQLERFRYAPAQKEFEMVLRLVRGIAAYVSGKVASFAPGAVRMETPVGVIGLRGTQFVAALAPETGAP
ncbi:MAG TPA: FecR family protein [Bryobacteraceae bacterium]|nr:FecR family protein [Bryobacteraceae bacterium]